MNPQVLLVASSVEGNITAWDIGTATQLTSYKGNASPVNGLSLLGRDYLVASQTSKGSLHFWAWHKDQVHQRSFAAEPLTAVAATPDGLYCAAGGASGAIHIWEVSSGRLLRSWPAHYKAVTALAFSDCGGILVSGGEDTLVNAWLLAEVLDTSAGGGGASFGGGSGAGIGALGGGMGGGMAGGGAFGGPSQPQPLHSWSDHTLPVTAVVVGAGGANALVASASLDRSVKLRGLARGGPPLLSVALPAAVHSLVLDPAEHALYAGTATGAIYEVSLVGEEIPQDSSHSGSAPAAAAGTGSSGGGGEGRWRVMEGHGRPVTCLGFTGDAAYLVSGSEDQSVRVWDLRSRQQVRVLPNPAKGPVTSLLVIDRPPFMQVGGSHTATAASQATSSKKGPKRPQPLAPFAKYANAPGALKPWEGGLVILDGSACSACCATLGDELAAAGMPAGSLGAGADAGAELAALGADAQAATAAAAAGAGGAAGGVGGGMGAGRDGAAAAGGDFSAGQGGRVDQGDVAALREENERLKEQLGRALQAAQQWGQVNVQLQQMCGDLLAGK